MKAWGPWEVVLWGLWTPVEGLVLGQDPGGLGKGVRLEEHRAGRRQKPSSAAASSLWGQGGRRGATQILLGGYRFPGQTGGDGV